MEPEDNKELEPKEVILEAPKKPVEKINEPKKELTIDIRLNKHQAVFAISIFSLIVLAAVCYFTGIIAKGYESVYWSDAVITITDTKDSKPLAATVGLKNIKQPKYSAQATTSAKGESTLTKLVQGDYALTLSKDGYIAKNETIKLTKGHNLLNYTLEKVPAAKVSATGIIQNYISEQPLPNIEIALGDRTVKTGSDGRFTFTQTPTGDITLSIKSDNYLSFSSKFTVSKSSNDIGKINLVPVGTIVFASNRDKGKQGIYVSNYDSTDQKPLISRVGDYEDFNPTLSPDRKKVLFTSSREGKKDTQNNSVSQLFLVDITGKNLTKISDKSISSYFWSKDNKKVGWTSYSDNKTDAYIYDLDLKKNIQLSVGNNISNLIFNDAVSKVAYNLRTLSSQYEIYLANIDGTNEEKITNNLNWINLFYFTTNTKLLYSISDSATKYYSYDLSSKTATETQYDISRPNGPKSSDGKYSAYLSNRDGKNNVFISTIDGKNERKLTTIDTVQGEISWSLDSKMIFFTSMKSGENAMYVVSIDGGAAKKIVDVANMGYGY